MKAWLSRHGQRIAAHAQFDRHVHGVAYAAIVLSGRYWESGDGGRREAGPGSIVIHEPFMAHANRVGASNVMVINVPLAPHEATVLRSGVVDDPEAMLKNADDRNTLVATLTKRLVATPGACDLMDRLARDLDSGDVGSLGQWACDHGVNPRTLLRRFRSAYQVTPAEYRLRARSRRAWLILFGQPRPSLAEIAHTCGFADQAHMSRAIRWLTGCPPQVWRTAGVSV